MSRRHGHDPIELARSGLRRAVSRRVALPAGFAGSRISPSAV